MKQNQLVVGLFAVVAISLAFASMHFAQKPARESLDFRAAFVRTHRGALDALKDCVTTGAEWTLTSSTSEVKGAALPAGREAECRKLLEALGAVSVHAAADGASVAIVTAETGREGNGVTERVAYLLQPGAFATSLPNATITLVDDEWYLVSTPR
jgi:hypothetical protein